MPAGSTAMVASRCAPIRLHSSSDISAGIGWSAATSQIHPSTSVSHERYSNGPPCTDFCRKVRRKSRSVAGASGRWLGAHPTAWSSRCICAAGSS
ncbi:hypothetical protein D522_10962 [Mycobacterium avium subsp. paratuberculosis S5]|nr:hypothetical protein D522_10962 [Mycobacterium avium subsp. paratuberculosis S5]